jgi:hypothetical protein
MAQALGAAQGGTDEMAGDGAFAHEGSLVDKGALMVARRGPAQQANPCGYAFLLRRWPLTVASNG